MSTTSEPLSRNALSAIIAGRAPGAGRFFKSEDTVAYLPEPVEFQVDEQRMSVGPVVISTPAVDRVGDVLLPTGCRFDDYAKNPVVLWDHGYNSEAGGSMPIASAADPDGNLSFEVTDEAITSFAYFHGKTLLSDQVFQLVAAKIIKAASVRPTPIVSSLITHGDTDQIGILMEEWEISEWSFVAIGCNQEALIKTARDNRLNGQRLESSLLKSLKQFVPEQSVKGIGMAFKTKSATKPKSDNTTEDDEETKKKKKTAPEDDDVPKRKSVDEDDELPEETGEDKSKRKSEPEPEDEEPDDETGTLKYGAQVLSAMHASIKELTANVEGAIAPLENEEVKAAASEMLESLKAQAAAIEGLYAAQYADSPSLGPAPDEDDEKSDEPDEEALKSFLSGGILNRSQWSAYTHRLKGLLTAKNLTPQQRRLLSETCKGMRRVEQESRAHVKSALEIKLDKLTKLFEANQKKLAEFLPHQRGH